MGLFDDDDEEITIKREPRRSRRTFLYDLITSSYTKRNGLLRNRYWKEDGRSERRKVTGNILECSSHRVSH